MSVVGCLRYSIGYKTLQERDDHVRSHTRPFKCPERRCFYGEVGFVNTRSLDKHISLSHTDPAPSKFIFPKLSKPRIPTKDERLRFRTAIRNQNLDLIRDLIDTNSSLRDRVTDDGYTGLQYAARCGKLENALYLLSCGSDIGTVNKHGTALNVACSSRQIDMVRFLLLKSRCAEDVNSKDMRGNTPLSTISGLLYSKSGVIARLGISRLLLEDSRVIINTKNLDGRTPLSLTAVLERTEAVPLLDMLLGNDRPGIDIDARDNGGRTPLSWAAGAGDREVVKLFLQHGKGIDVNAKDAGGRTPLSWAAARECSPQQELIAATVKSEIVQMVEMLLKYDGIDVGARDNSGRTPLSWAASTNIAGVVKAFLRLGR